jgi:hypothetical protein
MSADRIAIVMLPGWRPGLVEVPGSGKNTKVDFDGFVDRLFAQTGYDQKPGALLVVHDVRGERVAIRAGEQMLRRIGPEIPALLQTHYSVDALRRLPSVTHMRALMQLLGAIAGNDTGGEMTEGTTGEAIDGSVPGPGVYDGAGILSAKDRGMIRHMINSRSREQITLAILPDYRVTGLDPDQKVQTDPDFASFVDHAAEKWRINTDGFKVLIMFDVASQQLEVRTGTGFFNGEIRMLNRIWKPGADAFGYGPEPEYRFFQDAMFLTIQEFPDAGDQWRRYMLTHDPATPPKEGPTPFVLPLYPVTPAPVDKDAGWIGWLKNGGIGAALLAILGGAVYVRRSGTPEHKVQSARRDRIRMWKKRHGRK